MTRRVLIVDDAATVRMYHRGILEHAGFAVDEAENGYEGLEKAMQGGYDLFLIDVNMPKLDGYSLLRRLRADPVAQSVPVIIITTETQDGDVALTAGANFCMTKPVSPEMLALYVRMACGA
ncbi:response regulator [Niveibacterium sp. SC-1]|uniref:response regulator n=1 Tax=Niveibacterium sp. SC-1 TaxID=3135646 RepID=UPI00311E64FE